MAGRPLRRARLGVAGRTCDAPTVSKAGERFCLTAPAIGHRCAHHFDALAASFAKELEGVPLVPALLPDVDYAGLSPEQVYGVGLFLQARENHSAHAEAAEPDEELVLQ